MNSPIKNFSQTFAFQWLLSFVICLCVHIPYFVGKHCSFDGDEAIVGMMAQDLLHGRNIPVYFYGQQYGFSFFEVIGVAIAMIFFGSSVWSLKIGSLLIFSIGIGFLFRLLQKNKIPLGGIIISILILSCFPAWIIWSAKARGGYVTAFSTVCILFYFIQTKKADLKWIIISAFVFSISLHSQLIIASCILFLWIGWVVRSKKISGIIMAVFSLVLFYFLLKIPAWYNTNYWTVPFVLQYHYTSIYPFIRELYKSALGYFYYEMTFQPTVHSLLFGVGYYFMAGILAAIFFIKTKTNKVGFILLLMGSFVAFFLVMAMRIPTHRYLLGLFTGILLQIVWMMSEFLQNPGKMKYAFLVMLTFAFGSAKSAKNIPDAWFLPEANDMQMYNGLLTELKKRDINHVFVTEPLLQWMLCYSGINARYTSSTERVNTYLKKVDQCFIDPECKTALVGFKGFYNYMDTDDWNQRVIFVNDKYFVYEEPSLNTLSKGNYEFLVPKR